MNEEDLRREVGAMLEREITADELQLGLDRYRDGLMAKYGLDEQMAQIIIDVHSAEHPEEVEEMLGPALATQPNSNQAEIARLTGNREFWRIEFRLAADANRVQAQEIDRLRAEVDRLTEELAGR